MKHKLVHIKIILMVVIMLSLMIIPYHVSGEVQPITEVQEKLEGISKEEKVVLARLFTITQEMEELEREITRITHEINIQQVHIEELESEIDKKQKDYDDQLELMQQVLISYQRGGPATYLEILLKADNLTEFLKSINLIKDISRNVGELLDSLEEGKKVLEEEKDNLAQNVHVLEQKKAELQEPLLRKQQLKEDQEAYLSSLQEESGYYLEQLGNLEQMWEDCKLLFSEIVREITKVVGDGYFTMEDLNLSFHLFTVKGAIYEDTFNKIIKEHSDLSETNFRFNSNQVKIEVPDKHLVLTGNFKVQGESSIIYEVSGGSFYDMPLENASIHELFKEGPLLIEFKDLAGDMVIIKFTLLRIESQKKQLLFEIKPEI